MRVKQREGTRGSLKWLQMAVNRRPDLLQHPEIGSIEWLSPLREDDYAEYRDAAFLQLVGCSGLYDDLARFWPIGGPQWDALGRSGETVILVEAKAHIAEMLSPRSQASASSLLRIESALASVRRDIGCKFEAPWTTVFYQLANRLAHLHFMRSRGVDARLLLVGFIGDAEMGGPQTLAEWQVAYQVAEYAMGLQRSNPLARFIHHVHPNVAELGG